MLKLENEKAKLLNLSKPDLTLTKLCLRECISKIALLHSDIVAHPPIGSDDCYQDLLKYCSADAPFLILHKSHSDRANCLLQSRAMKPLGFLTTDGNWIPNDDLNNEYELAHQLSLRWQKQHFFGPPPFTVIGGHPVQLESYHHRDLTNLNITVNTNAGNSKVPVSFIRLGSKYTQALLR
jgi:hypothetical protein